MKVAVTGSSGLIGSHLVAALRADGHEVLTLVRRPPRAPGEVRWDPAAGTIDAAALAGVDAAVNLAGPGIGAKRWTDAYRRTLRESRVQATNLIATTLAQLDPRPRVLISASAIGYYGDRAATPLTEDASPGNGFLADLCRDWEAATAPAAEAGIRVCLLRTGIVLSRTGGALRKQLPIFYAGLGGPLGSGEHYVSWISLDDEIAAIRFLLETDISGPVNLTAPNPLPQKHFARALGKALHRPAVIPVPQFAVRLALGPFADEGVLAGQRVLPGVLQQAGFAFADPDIAAGLASALHR